MSISNFEAVDFWTMLFIIFTLMLFSLWLLVESYVEEEEPMECNGVTVGHCCGEHPQCHHEKDRGI